LAIWEKVTSVTSPSWTSIGEVTTPSWTSISKVTSPSWTSISEVTTPSWDLVTILNSITYSESSGDTPSTDGIDHWENTTGKWELYSYEWDKLVF